MQNWGLAQCITRTLIPGVAVLGENVKSKGIWVGAGEFDGIDTDVALSCQGWGEKRCFVRCSKVDFCSDYEDIPIIVGATIVFLNM